MHFCMRHLNRRDIMKKKRKWIGVILVVALLAFVGAGAVFLMHLSANKGEPVGTPNVPPAVDQRPVSDSMPSEKDSKHENSKSAVSDSDSKNAMASESSTVPTRNETIASDFSAEAQEEQILHGTIVDAATSTLTVKSSQTEENLSFMRETADITGRLVEGAEVDVYYIGKIEGKDTAGAYVTRIIAYP